MKVLQINTVYRTGGSTGRIVHDLKGTMESHFIEAYVGYGHGDFSDDNSRVFRMQGKLNLKLSILKTRLWGRHGFYNYKSTRCLLNFIDQVNPDVIHLHNIHGHYLNIKLLFNYIKSKAIPVVWTLHDCWAFTGWCAYFDYKQCGKWKTECNHCPSLKDYPCTWFFDTSRKNYYDKKSLFLGVENLVLVTPSQWLANLSRESFLNNYPVKVIHNGTDISVFKPCGDNIKEKLGIGGKKMILAIAARLEPRKGAKYLLRLPYLLNGDEVLVLLGLTKEQLSVIPSERCIGIEYTNSLEELASYYSAADVFINPTLEDNFPTTNIEALACGTPIVTFRTGGSIEVINNTTGFVVDKGDINGLLKSIRVILQKGKSAYMEACRGMAVAEFNKEKQYVKYINLYKTLCHNE